MTQNNENDMSTSKQAITTPGVDDRHLPHPHRTHIEPRGGLIRTDAAEASATADTMTPDVGHGHDAAEAPNGADGDGFVVFDDAPGDDAGAPPGSDDDGYGAVMTGSEAETAEARDPVENASTAAGDEKGPAPAADAEADIAADPSGHGFVFLAGDDGADDDEPADAESFGYVFEDGGDGASLSPDEEG